MEAALNVVLQYAYVFTGTGRSSKFEPGFSELKKVALTRLGEDVSVRVHRDSTTREARRIGDLVRRDSIHQQT